MNGDLGKIYNKLTEVGDDVHELKTTVAVLEERQENQHEENKTAITSISKCITNCPVNTINGQVKLQWFVLALLLTGMLSVFWHHFK